MALLALRRTMIQTVTKEASSLSGESVTAIINHLLSDAIGVDSLEGLGLIEEGMFPDNIRIPLLQKKKILIAFKKLAAPVTAPDLDENRGQQAEPHQPVPYQGLALPEVSYSYTVPWARLSKPLVDSLMDAKRDRLKASPEQKLELTREIAGSLKTDYDIFKRQNQSVTQKVPGRKIYKSIAQQIDTKLQDTFFVYINGILQKSSLLAFVRDLEIKVDNRYKKDKLRTRRTVRSWNVPGVLSDQYLPTVNDPENQEETMAELQTIFSDEHPDLIDYEQVLELMRSTYELQREHISAAKKKVTRQTQQAAAAAPAQQVAASSGDEGDSEDDNAVPVRALEQLSEKWPFLFKLQVLEWHHQRLTGRALLNRARDFITEHLEHIEWFLVSSTTTNKENIIQLLRSKKSRLNQTPEYAMLTVINMVSQCFGYDIKDFIKTTERTSSAELFEHTVLSNVEHPCIVALDDNMYKADKFFVCADKVALTEVQCPLEAIVALVMTCFVLDLQYPPLPKLFEFLERYVLGIPVETSRVRQKNGNPLTFLSRKVQKFSEEYEIFRVDLINAVN